MIDTLSTPNNHEDIPNDKINASVGCADFMLGSTVQIMCYVKLLSCA